MALCEAAKVVSRASPSRMTITFLSAAVTLNATHCVPKWYCEPKTGDGVRCGGGCKNLNRNSCFHPGRFLGYPIRVRPAPPKTKRFDPFDCSGVGLLLRGFVVLADQSGPHRPGSVEGIAPSRFHRPRVGGATTDRLQNPKKSRSDRPPLTLSRWRRD